MWEVSSGETLEEIMKGEEEIVTGDERKENMGPPGYLYLQPKCVLFLAGYAVLELLTS